MHNHDDTVMQYDKLIISLRSLIFFRNPTPARIYCLLLFRVDALQYAQSIFDESHRVIRWHCKLWRIVLVPASGVTAYEYYDIRVGKYLSRIF